MVSTVRQDVVIVVEGNKSTQLGGNERLTSSDSPTSSTLVQSDVEIPRIESLCFLELDSQKWRCTEFRGNFYKVIFFLPLLLPISRR